MVAGLIWFCLGFGGRDAGGLFVWYAWWLLLGVGLFVGCSSR